MTAGVPIQVFPQLPAPTGLGHWLEGETCKLQDLRTLGLISLRPHSPENRAPPSPKRKSGWAAKARTALGVHTSRPERLTLLPFGGRACCRLRAGRADGDLGGTVEPQGAVIVLGDLREAPRLQGSAPGTGRP